MKRLPSVGECGAFPAQILCTQFCFTVRYLRCWHNDALIVGRHKCPDGKYDKIKVTNPKLYVKSWSLHSISRWRI